MRLRSEFHRMALSDILLKLLHELQVLGAFMVSSFTDTCDLLRESLRILIFLPLQFLLFGHETFSFI